MLFGGGGAIVQGVCDSCEYKLASYGVHQGHTLGRGIGPHLPTISSSSVIVAGRSSSDLDMVGGGRGGGRFEGL